MLAATLAAHFRHGASVEEVTCVVELKSVKGTDLGVGQRYLELSRDGAFGRRTVGRVLPEVAENAGKGALCSGEKDGAAGSGSAVNAAGAALHLVEHSMRPPGIDARLRPAQTPNRLGVERHGWGSTPLKRRRGGPENGSDRRFRRS